MRQPTEVCTPIHYEELAVLTAWCGVKAYYGFHAPARKIDRRQMLRILQELYRKKAIISDGDQFRVCQPYRKMLHYLAGSREIWGVKAIGKALPPICCYVGEQILLMSPSLTREGTLLMEYVERRELLVHLTLEGYLPEEISLPGEEWIYRTGGREILVCRRIVQDGEAAAALKLLEYPEGFVMCVADGQKEERMVFSQKGMLEVLEGYWRAVR